MSYKFYCTGNLSASGPESRMYHLAMRTFSSWLSQASCISVPFGIVMNCSYQKLKGKFSPKASSHKVRQCTYRDVAIYHNLSVNSHSFYSSCPQITASGCTANSHRCFPRINTTACISVLSPKYM